MITIHGSIQWPTIRIQIKSNLAKKEPDKYHYNPGNMSGKTADSGKPESEQRANVDRIKSRGKQPHSRDD